MKTVYKVTKLESGTVYHDRTSDAKANDYSQSEDGLMMFAPGGYCIPFNYISPEQKEGLTISIVGDTATISGTSTETEYSVTTETTYDGIKIARSGNDYTLTGKLRHKITMGTTSSSTFTMEYKTLKVASDADGVTSVSGGLVAVSNVAGDNTSSNDINMDFKTEDSALKAKGTMKGSPSSTVAVSEFYSTVVPELEKPTYEGVTVTESTEKIGDVTATVYTCNGSYVGDEETHTVKDLKMYGYGGYLLKMTGTEDDISGTRVVTITI